MSIKIVVSDTVKFNVKGAIKNAQGVDDPFSFSLTALRLDAEQIQERLQSSTDTSIADFFAELVEDWSGVKDADDKPLAYSHDALRRLFKLPGLAAISLRTYISEVGAKEKN